MRTVGTAVGMMAAGTIAILVAEYVLALDEDLTGYLIAAWLCISLYFGFVRPDLRQHPRPGREEHARR